ncbi:MAG: hypothetical protein AAF493_06125 [Pseudomonadota bacterium]
MAALECWSCGGSLEAVERPISRYGECPQCRADLHVCRLCRFYTRHYIGECSHDRADGVLVKDKANYCSHFRPQPKAYSQGDSDRDAQSRSELAALFGDDIAVPTSQADELAKERTAARSELDALFGIDEADESKDESSDGESDGPLGNPFDAV